MKIKKVFLDVYGTILASDDSNNIVPPRKGLEEIAKHAIIETISDCSPNDVMNDLQMTYNNCRRYHNIENPLNYIDQFYHLRENPKEIHMLISTEEYPQTILVVGDSDKDEIGAKLANCIFVRVPTYKRESTDTDLWKYISHLFME